MKKFLYIFFTAVLIFGVSFLVLRPHDVEAQGNGGSKFVTEEELSNVVQTNIDLIWTEMESMKNETQQLKNRVTQLENRISALE